MTNYDGIIRMTPDQLESFLEQVHLVGLITGGYVARTGYDEKIEANPFTTAWLADLAEEAVEFAGNGAPFLGALADAIGRLQPEILRETKVQEGNVMPKVEGLWDEWVKQSLRLQEQQARVLFALKELADAVLQGRITDRDEIDEIMLGLAVFADYYSPAGDLFRETCGKIAWQ